MLDAPLSGSPVTVQQGNASLMIGGDRATFERLEPVLKAIGPKVTYIGASGQAATMKLAVNLLLMVEVVAFGEPVALAEKRSILGKWRWTPFSRASPQRPFTDTGVHSFSKAECPRCRSPMSRCSKRTCCWSWNWPGNWAVRRPSPQPLMK